MGNGGTYSRALTQGKPLRIKLCKCGGNCGLSWQTGAYQSGGARKYHPDCPVMRDRKIEKKRAKYRRIYARKKLTPEAREAERLRDKLSRIAKRDRERAAREAELVAQGEQPEPPGLIMLMGGKACHWCEGMSWRRAKPQCRGCGEPFAEEEWQAEPIKNRSPTAWMTSH